MLLVMFLICWLLCTMAFLAVPPNPAGVERLIRAVGSGALVAICIVFLPRLVN